MKTTPAAFLSVLALSLLASCGAGAAGTYAVDEAELRKAMMTGLTDEERSKPETAKLMDEMLNGMDITFDLQADGTATLRVKMVVAGQRSDDSKQRTWKLDGERLTITRKLDKTLKEEGRTVDYKDGSFTMEEEVRGRQVMLTFKKR
ncbi:MAG TPA: hypothetical protein VF384_17845 [Planctomycetota bacterium]